MEIPFKRPDLEDRETILRHMSVQKHRGCERTFANAYLWARFYNLGWAEISDTLVFRIGEEENYAKEKGYPFHMHSVSREEMEELEQYFPEKFQVEWDRDVADYVYETEKLTNLSGKKYHSKKNHINQFKAANPDWSYESITDENVEECFQMALKWRTENGCDEHHGKNSEMCVTLNSLRLFKELELRGGILRVNGQIVAFTMGEPACDDTFVVHIEKAYAEVRGAYPMINQQFLEHEVADYKYVNREDDTGDEGLRKAKLSYRPVFMVEKGNVTVRGDI